MPRVERRKKFIINIVYFAILLVLFSLYLKYALIPLLPIEIAAVLAILLQSPIKKISEKTRIKKSVVATISVVLVLLILALLLVGLGTKLVLKVVEFVQYVQVNLEDYTWVHNLVYSVVDRLPNFIHEKVIEDVDLFMGQLEVAMEKDAAAGFYNISLSAIDFQSIFSEFTEKYASGVISTAKQIPSILVAVVICVVLSCFMTSEYDIFSDGVHRMFKGGENNIVSATKRVLISSVGGLLKAYGCICLCTFAEMLIGLTVLSAIGVFHSNYLFVIALVSALFDILPVVGIGTILIPWFILCFIQGNYGLGIGLAIMWVIIFIIRQIIEPKFVSGVMSLPPALTLAVMYVGLKVSGVLGMFAFVIALYVIASLEKEHVIDIFADEIEAETLPPVDAVTAPVEKEILEEEQDENKEPPKKEKAKKEKKAEKVKK